MKNFYRQNYYELLEIGPEASLDEITRAYQQALEAFDEDSVAIYSLFDAEERENLLKRINDAYRILSHSPSRREYDRQLLAQGIVSAEEVLGHDQAEEAEVVEVMVEEALPGELAPLTSLVKTDGEPLSLNEGGVLRGSDLKKLRQSRQVSLESLSQRTRISVDTLLAIESDLYHRLPARVYVKGFLSAYAKALMLDSEKVSRAYMAGMAQ